tara:strand:- start:360 stop:560 length:201 start_codon:yes stop_codon:yes gene_type:complete
MIYLISYTLIGLITCFIIDYLNQEVLHPEDRVTIDWFMRLINTILWPIIVGGVAIAAIRYLIGKDE